eukprot:1960507-Pyramimonas_sp.AAC.1
MAHLALRAQGNQEVKAPFSGIRRLRVTSSNSRRTTTVIDSPWAGASALDLVDQLQGVQKSGVDTGASDSPPKEWFLIDKRPLLGEASDAFQP